MGEAVFAGKVFAKSCERMDEIPDASVQCCVTSPPYYGLRDYGVEGQIGLEPTVAAYVERLVGVFREVRRVLRADGLAFLNLGDSYAGFWGAQGHGEMSGRSVISARQIAAHPDKKRQTGSLRDAGLKAKDLIGIPWRVARALQEPYYTGTIRDEMDRVWLAAMIDGEGCIFIHKRKAGQSNGQGYVRTNPSFGAGLEVANTNEAIVRRCLEITGRGSICDQTGHGRKQKIFRWNLRSNECRHVLREVYPYLVAKQQQARLAIGCPSSGPDAEAAHGALIGLHNGVATGVDFAPPKRADLWSPGWWLRDAIVWSKLNPMPSSVSDRCTSSYEMVFMLAKSARYFSDMNAVREPLAAATLERIQQAKWKSGEQAGSTRANGGAKTNGPMRAVVNAKGLSQPPQIEDGSYSEAGANLRNVWRIATTPYADAHFATMPVELALRCIRIGSRIGDVILDPFMGSGTTAQAAESIDRKWTGYELNPAYHALIAERVRQPGLFGGVA